MKLISNCFDNHKSVNIQEQRGGVIFLIFLLREYIFRYGHSFHTRQKGFQMSSSHRTHLTPKTEFHIKFVKKENRKIFRCILLKTKLALYLIYDPMIKQSDQQSCHVF
jgi:hypothetical protein